ncbi:hypothetical protein GCM10007939_02960 [Amylibacter marinus]|uniref:Uncharacterized protein n=1 Tax=Amylibacter marinus TaxID=1475483 RepID=A0ABQ5VRH7_9RHOB|nr:glycosyltransferase [Amylibacter marinus]GLQ34013.1 hypothetical protein GCM10007939_02960 [Amylibacter marinus]
MREFIYFEPRSDGHSAFFADMILASAMRDPRVDRVRLICAPDLADRIATKDVDTTVLDPRNLRWLQHRSAVVAGLAQWRAACRYVRGNRQAVCFLPFFDHAILGAALDFKRAAGQVSGILFRVPNGYGQVSNWRSRLKNLCKRTLYRCSDRRDVRRIFRFDPFFPVGLGRQMEVIPDPAPRIDIQTLGGQRSGSKTCFLMFGAIARRKGIFVLLEALAHLSPVILSRMELRIVGRIDRMEYQEIDEALAQAKQACPDLELHVSDAFASDTHLRQEIAGADVILAPYQDHVGSSGVLFWAAAAGKPVIAQCQGLMGQWVHQYSLGAGINSTDPMALAEALGNPVEMCPQNAQRFVQEHQQERFAQGILDGLL